MYQKIAVVGCTGAIGQAMIKHLRYIYPSAEIFGFARREVVATDFHAVCIDYHDEDDVASAVTKAAQGGGFDLVLVATGMLHQTDIKPEKSLSDLTAEQLQQLYWVNAVVPALMMKYFIPKLVTDRRAVFAVLSARVGSISDNRLGGWYSYRAAKAALNMLVKNASIEATRFHKQQLIVGLHPGTVDSALSEPFQSRVPQGKLFTPDFSVSSLLNVMNELDFSDSGKCFAWDGQEILP